MKKYIFLLSLLAMAYTPVAMAQDSQDEGSHSVRISANGSKYSISRGNQGFDVNYDGEVRFNDDFTDFSYISPGGYVTISKTSFGNKRRLELKGKTGGTIKREYWDGGTEKPYEPQGRKFLEEMLPLLFRNTRLGAEDRVSKLYAKGGTRAVIQDIKDKESSYIKAHYLDLTFNLENLNNQDKIELLEIAGKEIDSDFELSRLLRNVGVDLLNNASTKDAFLQAVAEIDSDFETARILRELIKEFDLTDPRMIEILEGMDSDFEKGRILTEAVNQPGITVGELNTVLSLLETIDSDFEKSKVMREVVTTQTLKVEGVKLVLDRIQEMDSDFEKSRVLQELVSMYDLGDEALTLALRSLENIDSDFEKSKILQKLIKEQKYSEVAFRAMLNNLNEIDSDFERSRLLGMMMEEEAFNKGTFDLLLNSIGELDSDFERSKLLKEATTLPDLQVSDFEKIIKAAEKVDGFERRKVLESIIEEMPKSDRLEAAITEAAKSLDDHDYGSVMRKLSDH